MSATLEKEIYENVINEVVRRNPEISNQIYEAPKILTYELPEGVIGAVADYRSAPWLKRQLGYEKPPVFFNPKYARMLNTYDLMAVVYHEAVHEAQIDDGSISNIIDKYIEFENEAHREKFYRLRKFVMELPFLRKMMMEGEAQYLTRKAFPNVSECVVPYWLEESLYENLIKEASGEGYLNVLMEYVMVDINLGRAIARYAS